MTFGSLTLLTTSGKKVFSSTMDFLFIYLFFSSMEFILHDWTVSDEINASFDSVTSASMKTL